MHFYPCHPQLQEGVKTTVRLCPRWIDFGGVPQNFLDGENVASVEESVKESVCQSYIPLGRLPTCIIEYDLMRAARFVPTVSISLSIR